MHAEEVLVVSKSAKIFIAQLVEHLTTPSCLSSKPIVRYLANPVVITAPNVIGTLHNFHSQIVATILAHQNPRPSPASDKYPQSLCPLPLLGHSLEAHHPCAPPIPSLEPMPQRSDSDILPSPS